MGPSFKTAKTVDLLFLIACCIGFYGAKSLNGQVESADGVLQHPLGRHKGQRVWGGGIVKLRYGLYPLSSEVWPLNCVLLQERGMDPVAD